MTKTLVLYRKDVGIDPVTIPAADVKDDRAAIEDRCRVKRDALLDHFAPSARGRSAFHRQPAVRQNVIDNPDRRMAEYGDAGWIIPESCYGRAPKNGERDYDSTAQSVLLWLKQTVVAAGWCDAAEISIVVEDRED